MTSRLGWMLLVGAAVLSLALRGDAVEKKAPANKRTGTIEGVIAANNLGLGAGKGELLRIGVQSPKDAGTLRITPQTKIVKGEGEKQVMALPKDLTVGSTVRVTYDQPVMQSRPWQSTAFEVLILKQAK